jgi:hypothetical protein
VASRFELFDALVALAKARVVAAAGDARLSPADAGFLVRALYDLENDGIVLFDGERDADSAFFDDVAGYLAARVGPEPVQALVLAPFAPGELAALPPRATLEDAVMQLVIQSEVKT